MKKKILDKILKATESAALENNHFSPAIRAEFFRLYQSAASRKQPKPVTKDHHIGIEIECYSVTTKHHLIELMLELDLEENMFITDDGSIEPPDNTQAMDINGQIYNTYELRVLSTEKHLAATLSKLDILIKQAKLKVNDSCGLHVHLDMRHRKVDKCYKKLMKSRDILFGIVDEDRWDNDYCLWEDDGDRYVAINKNAYHAHKTIEVRLHHGSVDTVKIHSWIRLLVKIVNSAEVPVVKKKVDVLRWAKDDKETQDYIRKNFKAKWFKERERVIKNSVIDDDFDQDEDYW